MRQFWGLGLGITLLAATTSCANAGNAWDCEPTRQTAFIWSFACKGGVVGTVHRQILCDPGNADLRARCRCLVDQKESDGTYVSLSGKSSSEVITLANTSCGWNMKAKQGAPSSSALPAEGQ